MKCVVLLSACLLLFCFREGLSEPQEKSVEGSEEESSEVESISILEVDDEPGESQELYDSVSQDSFEPRGNVYGISTAGFPSSGSRGGCKLLYQLLHELKKRNVDRNCLIQLLIVLRRSLSHSNVDSRSLNRPRFPISQSGRFPFGSRVQGRQHHHIGGFFQSGGFPFRAGGHGVDFPGRGFPFSADGHGVDSPSGRFPFPAGGHGVGFPGRGFPFSADGHGVDSPSGRFPFPADGPPVDVRQYPPIGGVSPSGRFPFPADGGPYLGQSKGGVSGNSPNPGGCSCSKGNHDEHLPLPQFSFSA